MREQATQSVPVCGHRRRLLVLMRRKGLIMEPQEVRRLQRDERLQVRHTRALIA
jgi:hypothetical protein